MVEKERETPFVVSLIAGGLAGTTVDLALFPIDTIKTRLQSPKGFIASGGFKGVYNGVGAAALGSAPGAALFFGVYEKFKIILGGDDNNRAVVHMTAASLGESAACLVRVPTEVVKQNMQIATAGPGGAAAEANTFTNTVKMVLAQKSKDGNAISNVFGGLYRGYGVTLFREIPFAMIQFPLYEQLKVSWAKYQNVPDVSPLQAAACGSFSGGIAAAFTTPLDVIKTRLMIGADKDGVVYKNAMDTLRRVWTEEGWRRLFSGIEPRVIWISIGGFVYFGAYEEFRSRTMTICGYEE